MNRYNFTERMRGVLANARFEAAALAHEYVGTEHLLLALVKDDNGVAVTVLDRLDVDRTRVADILLEVVRPGKPHQESVADFLPYTSRSKKVLELAMEEARSLNHSFVGTEHLLLGILGEGKGVGAHALQSCGATPEAVRAETLSILGTELTPGRRLRSTPLSELPLDGEKLTRVSLTLQYASGAVVAKQFSNATEAALFLTEQ